MTTTLVALYDDVRTAHQVVDDLHNHNFERDNISLIARDADSRYASYTESYEGDNDAAEGAGIGAVIGGIGGLLVGLGALAIPGVGPVVAAGPIVAGLTGAGVGAVAGGIVGALVDMGLPEEEAHHYAEGVRRGGTLVSVQVVDDQVNEAIDIMESHRPVDINNRATAWRESGWTRFDHNREPMTRNDIEREYKRHGVNIDGNGHRSNDFTSHSRDGAIIDEIVEEEHPRRSETATLTARSADSIDIDVVEEDVKVGKRQVERGGIRVRKYLVEEPVEEQVTLEETRVNVERRPVDRPASQADFDTFEEGTLELTETAEELVVSKEARVTEEIHVSKEHRQHTETVHETARRTEVDIEEVGDGHRRGFDDFDSNFRQHHKATFGESGENFDYYAPAYRHGYDLNNDGRYQGREWNDIEANARNDWMTRYEKQHGAAWEDVSDAVQHGWRQSRGSANRRNDIGDYEPDFRRHYETTFDKQDRDYDYYAPAYRYGYELAGNAQYHNRSWNDIEANARNDWASRYQSDTGAPWDDIRDAVRHGWDRTRTGANQRELAAKSARH